MKTAAELFLDLFNLGIESKNVQVSYLHFDDVEPDLGWEIELSFVSDNGFLYNLEGRVYDKGLTTGKLYLVETINGDLTLTLTKAW